MKHLVVIFLGLMAPLTLVILNGTFLNAGYAWAASWGHSFEYVATEILPFSMGVFSLALCILSWRAPNCRSFGLSFVIGFCMGIAILNTLLAVLDG